MKTQQALSEFTLIQAQAAHEQGIPTVFRTVERPKRKGAPQMPLKRVGEIGGLHDR